MTPAEQLAQDREVRPKARRVQSPPVWKCKLAALRENLGLSQAEVAAAVELSRQHLSYVETGVNVSLWTALRLAKFYGKTVEEIWGQ